jgi:hypothetical protein
MHCRDFNAFKPYHAYVKGEEKMKCFLCERDENEVLLVQLPVETLYKESFLYIIGNYVDKEYMCLPCIGYEIDKSRGIDEWHHQL